MREGAVGIGENGCDRMKKVFMMFADPGSEFRFGERKNGVEAQFCGIGGEINGGLDFSFKITSKEKYPLKKNHLILHFHHH